MRTSSMQVPRCLHGALIRAVLVMVALGSCTGVIKEPPGRGPSGGGAGPSSSSPPPTMFVPAPATLRRLTSTQYRNTLKQLFGDSIAIPALEPDIIVSGYSSVGASTLAISPRRTEQYETDALAVARDAMSRDEIRRVIVPCTPAGVTDEVCVEKFLVQFGRRVFRRPLAADEIARYGMVASTASEALGDFWRGLEYAISGLLQSPQFLYRREMGTADGRYASGRRLDGYELASRLSFFLWDSTPDDRLLDAAGAGSLGSPTGLRAEAERLLAAQAGRDGLLRFYDELFALAGLEDLVQLPSIYRLRSDTLGASLRSEALRVFEDAVFGQERDIRELVDGRRTFVNAEIARLYGVPAPPGGGFGPVDLPESSHRAGILTQGAFLALQAHSTSTSPTRRGKFIRERLLCQTIPPPPSNVVTALPPDGAGGPRTMRQKLEAHRENAVCASCHSVMDPIGLGLENFDAIGVWRTMDAGQVIDASGDLDGVPFSDARGLARAVREHQSTVPCLVRNLFRFAGGHMETAGEEPVITALVDGFAAGGYRVRGLVLALIDSPAFLYSGDSP